MAMSDAPAPRGRQPRRADESRSEPAQPAAAMGVAKKSVFVLVVVARLREKGSPMREEENPIKEKEKATREEGDRTVADHPGQKEVSAPAALRPCVEGMLAIEPDRVVRVERDQHSPC